MPRKAGRVSGGWNQEYESKDGSDDSSNYVRRRDNRKSHYEMEPSEHSVGMIALKKLAVLYSYRWAKYRISETFAFECKSQMRGWMSCNLNNLNAAFNDSPQSCAQSSLTGEPQRIV